MTPAHSSGDATRSERHGLQPRLAQRLGGHAPERRDLLQHTVLHGRVDDARQDGIHPDVARCKDIRPGPGDAHHGRLARGIRRHVNGGRELGRAGREVDDGTSLTDRCAERLGQEERPFDVHGVQPAPLLEPNLPDGAYEQDAGGIDEVVDVAGCRSRWQPGRPDRRRWRPASRLPGPRPAGVPRHRGPRPGRWRLRAAGVERSPDRCRARPP